MPLIRLVYCILTIVFSPVCNKCCVCVCCDDLGGKCMAVQACILCKKKVFSALCCSTVKFDVPFKCFFFYKCLAFYRMSSGNYAHMFVAAIRLVFRFILLRIISCCTCPLLDTLGRSRAPTILIAT